VFNYAKLPETEYKSLVYSTDFCNNISMRIWIFLSTSCEKQVSENQGKEHGLLSTRLQKISHFLRWFGRIQPTLFGRILA